MSISNTTDVHWKWTERCSPGGTNSVIKFAVFASYFCCSWLISDFKFLSLRHLKIQFSSFIHLKATLVNI